MLDIEGKLNSVGMAFFLKYFRDIKSGDTTDNLIKIIKEKEPRLEIDSIRKRISTTRTIVNEKEYFREALQLCINAKYLSKSFKEIARIQLQILDAPEKRIARITWNTNGWVYPSGPNGKSKNEDLYEGMYGYGHEEWLFDTSKIIDGWHYSFLQPVHHSINSSIGKKFNIWLFAIDGNTKKRYWVGRINHVEVITGEQSEKAKQIYHKKGWLSEMGKQIVSSGANNEGFSNYHGVDIFNIRFKPTAIQLNEYYELPKDHPAYRPDRYTFLEYNKEYEITENKKPAFTFIHSLPETGTFPESALVTSTHEREAKTVEVPLLHKIIAANLVAKLRAEYGNKNVAPEHQTGNGASRIDIVVKDKDEKFIFYEIKTYNSLLNSIREATGQLLEYAFYPTKQNAKELVIITQKHGDVSDVKMYMEHLRKLFKIPIYYQWFDWEKVELSEKF